MTDRGYAVIGFVGLVFAVATVKSIQHRGGGTKAFAATSTPKQEPLSHDLTPEGPVPAAPRTMTTAGTRHLLAVLAVTPPVPTKHRKLSDAQLSSYLDVCRANDPMQRRAGALVIVQAASDLVGTDLALLIAKWRQESGFLAGGAGGSYDLHYEARRRDGHETYHSGHWTAVRRMYPLFKWNPELMTGSPPDRKPDGSIYGYGASWGPFQTSPAFDQAYVEDYGINPLTLCGGALYAALKLRKSYDSWMSSHPGSGNELAWKWAVKVYTGKSSEPCDGRAGEDTNVCGYRRLTDRLWSEAREWISSGNLPAIIAAKLRYEKP